MLNVCQVGKGPYASEVSGIVKIGQTMTMVLGVKVSCDWSADSILPSDWTTDLILTSDWSRTTRTSST